MQSSKQILCCITNAAACAKLILLGHFKVRWLSHSPVHSCEPYYQALLFAAGIIRVCHSSPSQAKDFVI